MNHGGVRWHPIEAVLLFRMVTTSFASYDLALKRSISSHTSQPGELFDRWAAHESGERPIEGAQTPGRVSRMLPVRGPPALLFTYRQVLQLRGSLNIHTALCSIS
jgi:hypothetical protein